MRWQNNGETEEMRIARIFPRKTTATPIDDLVFFGDPPVRLNIDEAHVDVTFSYDLDKANILAEKWSKLYPTKIGGVATGDGGDEFISGRYLKKGYVITSRGCPNDCWFCDVWKREGGVRELPIREGWNLLDSNILACSDQHIENVFAMLSRQKYCELTGGLEAARLQWWHIELLYKLRPSQMFFAYDTPDDLDPLIEAGKKMRYANFTRRHLRCYVLIGHPKDTFQYAEERLLDTWEAGFMPMAMLWKNSNGDENVEWRRFQRQWARPVIIKNSISKHLRGFIDTWEAIKQ